MPSRATTPRSFLHGLEQGGDLLECAVGCSGPDARDRPNQPAVTRSQKRPAQQPRLDDAFIDRPAHRAAQPLDGPSQGIALAQSTIQDAHDIAPRLVRTHAAHGWELGIELPQNAVAMCLVAPFPDLADRLRVAGAQTWIAADASTGPASAQGSLGPFDDQRPLELGFSSAPRRK